MRCGEVRRRKRACSSSAEPSAEMPAATAAGSRRCRTAHKRRANDNGGNEANWRHGTGLPFCPSNADPPEVR